MPPIFDATIRAISIPFILATVVFAVRHAVMASHRMGGNGFRLGHVIIYVTLALGGLVRLPHIISTFYPETHWAVEMMGTPVVTSTLWIMFGIGFYISDRSVRNGTRN